jgi:hypothetical protein
MEKGLLYVGCGGDPLPEWLHTYKETRLDINPDCSPDIVGDMRHLGDIGKFDCIFSQHSLEHIYPHEVIPTLQGFYDHLNDGGCVLIFVPDLEDVRATEEILFDAPAGPIAGLDLIYGYRKVLKEMPYMAHKNGFVSDTLLTALTSSGFKKSMVTRLAHYAMMGVGVK